MVTGASFIGNLLKVNCTLQVLVMGWNFQVGDDGIAAIAGALETSKIKKLDVRYCGITVTGAMLLAAALSLNESVISLWIGPNPITVEGARLLLESAGNNRVCQELIIDEEYKNDDDVKKLLALVNTKEQVLIFLHF